MENYTPKEIVTLQNKLSARMKEYEEILGEYPSYTILNELRFALRSAIDIIEILKKHPCYSELQNELKDKETQVYNSLLCAYFDLIDGLLMDVTHLLYSITKEYGDIAIEELGAASLEMTEVINNIDSLISKSRKNPERKLEIYEENYDDWFAKLIKIRNELNTSYLPKIVAQKGKEVAIQQQKAISKKNLYRFSFSLGLGLLLLNFGVPLALGGVVIGAIIGEFMGRNI